MADKLKKVCPECKASFSTKQALRQHRAAKHNIKLAAKKEATPRPVQRPQVSSEPPSQHNMLRQRVQTELGGTGVGSMWAFRYLHPCDEMQSGGERIPDLTSTATCAAELRVRHHLSAPADIGSSLTWSAMIVIPPSMELGCVVFTRPDSSKQWTSVNKVLDYPSVKLPRYVGLLPDLEAPLGKLTDACRATYRGVTCHLVASSTTNQGMVYAAQWAQVAEMTTAKPESGHEKPSGVEAQQIVQLINLPTNIDELYAKEGRTVQQEAKKGCYMPLRFVQPVSRFESPATRGIIWRIAGVSGSKLATYLDWTGNAAEPDKPYAPSDVYDTGYHLGTSYGPDNFNTGVIIFDGIDKAASIEIKIRSGVEGVPGAQSPWSPFIENSPVVDESAIKSAIGVAAQSELAFPVSYNDLGLLWSKVIQPLLKGVVRWAGPAVMSWART
uniref:Capsid protein n=1 Tax=Varroa destructor virus 9 TaxID=3059530 RepID=A0AA50ADD6_9VIRU|nr:MAG: capsid protein [Varroa destructor virus 9]